jgi:hypothetical protein
MDVEYCFQAAKACFWTRLIPETRCPACTLLFCMPAKTCPVSLVCQVTSEGVLHCSFASGICLLTIPGVFDLQMNADLVCGVHRLHKG